MLQFTRRHDEPWPAFGGTKGLEITKSLIEIESEFKTNVDKIRVLDYKIMEPKTTRWHDDYNY